MMHCRPGRVRLTRVFLITLLVALAACGLVGIAAILWKDFDELQWRILFTCLTTAYCSLTGLGCAVPLERELWKLPSLVGIVTSFCAYVCLVLGVWTDFFDSDVFAKTSGILCLFAAALAHICLLSLARLSPRYSWTRPATSVAAATLAVLISSMIILEEHDSAFFRTAGVLSVLVAVGTLAVPVLHRLSSLHPEAQARRVKPEELELFCPRCHRRQKVFLGGADCTSCGLEIHVDFQWEELQLEQT